MTTEQLRGMADEAFVEILAQRVVEKLLARQKQALVVYTGSNIGEAAALEAMGRLRGEGFTFRVLLSRGASGLLDVERLRSVLEPEKLWVETPEETPEALTARYDTILVPAMTVHTAAHVAACMADTPASAVILDGLMRGKNVVVNIDGCCPDHAERLKRGFHMAEPLKQALRNNLETFRSFGARLTTSGGLYDKALRAVGGAQARTAAPAARPEAAPRKQEGAARIRLEGRVLSGRHVQGCPPHSTLWVPRETLITQLAADEARRRDICIRKET